MTDQPATTLTRRDVYAGAVIDGRPAPNAAGRLRRQRSARCSCSRVSARRPSSSGGSAAQPAVTRPNIVALMSPKGGVGKTTSTFLVGNLLATHLKLRVIAVDANPDSARSARACTRRSPLPSAR